MSTSDTNDAPDKFPIWASRDLWRWDHLGWIFPRGRWPRWAVSDFWAPEIHRVDGRYLCYFTARDRAGRLCVGVAGARCMRGPWVDYGRPFIRDERVGMIDAHVYREVDGRYFLFWKEDGNDLEPRVPTRIFVQQLGGQGAALIGERRVVLENDLAWEGDVVEGPWAVRRGRWVYLFYSGNAFDSGDYATGVARALSPLGPFEKRGQPILARSDDWTGPGHGCLVRHQRSDWFVYHAWERDRIAGPHPRVALVSHIGWKRGWPTIDRTVALPAQRSATV